MANYKITLETPRTIVTKHGSEVVVDTFTSFIYGRKNKESALRKFGSVANLAILRKQGLQLNRKEYKESKKYILVERI
jgi:nucleoside-specific outer membrane channel protein Tsx